MRLDEEGFACFTSVLWAKINRTEDDQKPRWACGNGMDRFFYAKETCKELDIDFNEVLNKYPGRQHCDCELVFNAPR